MNTEHIVVTGGEPLLLPDIVPLTVRLQSLGHFVTLETAGTIYREATANLMSINAVKGVEIGAGFDVVSKGETIALLGSTG